MEKLWRVGGALGSVGSSLPALMFTWATFKQFFPRTLQAKLECWWDMLVHLLFPIVQITFHEYNSALFNRSHFYSAIESYLCSKAVAQATRLKAASVKKDQPILLALDDYEEVCDEFQGVELKWYRGKSENSKTISWHRTPDSRMYYTLSFPEKYRKLITENYLNHVMEEGKALEVKRRLRRLYMKNPSEDIWDYTVFHHPSTFDTYALDPKRKEAIVNDLITFSQAKDYYAKIGKVWKRGYLLYGPPGTGKSTMIAAMANLLSYDIYDLELTTIKNNSELKSLLINTTGKSIIVVEDIDCSLDLTGKREKKQGKDKSTTNRIMKRAEDEKNGDSKVTLSGFLNFVDGIWSACEGERIFVFTTNHVDQLDPALIRRGRMDMHIELSYCSFEAFKVLAKNYWDIDSHPLFDKIKQLLSEVNTTPADVAENLMPKTMGADVDTSLGTLIQALETAKEKVTIKAKEEEEAEDSTKAVEKGKVKAADKEEGENG